MKKNRAFVLIEVVIVFGMLAVITLLTTINVFGSNRSASLSGAVNALVADIKTQQMKAMTGSQSSGVTPLGYGVHFDTTGYTLFNGLIYSAADTSNSRVTNDTKLTFSTIDLPNNSIVFSSRSGDFVGYSQDANTITITHSDSGSSKTLQLNSYGIVTSIN